MSLLLADFRSTVLDAEFDSAAEFDMSHDFDLLIRAGRVVCPASGFDAPGGVAVRAGRIVAFGGDVSGTARETLDFPDAVLLPGLVDLHAHPAREGSKYGVDPDVEFLPRGVTTALSQGDAGADNWRRYRETTIEACRARVRLAINLSKRGESMQGGCFENMDDVDAEACIAAIEDGGDLIWGIAVNVSEIACGANDPREIVRRANRARALTLRPLLYGMRRPDDWAFEEQLFHLRTGDVVTYCFRSEPFGIVQGGRVHPAVRKARERGVLFDVGHGIQSFDFRVAEAALADGFPPDTISSDSYLRHVGTNPPHDLPRVMSKLMAVGMPEADAFAAVTSHPAAALGLSDEVGTLKVGACADLVVLKWNENAAPLTDVHGATRPGGCWEPALTIGAGEIICPAKAEYTQTRGTEGN
jgi:dihydroorotase